MTDPWPVRVANAPTPTALYHATTPKKLRRHEATGTILPPVRGFDSEAAARDFARRMGRPVLLRLTPSAPVWTLPDHHLSEGLAFWTLATSGWEVLL